jgi:hypothetical protein
MEATPMERKRMKMVAGNLALAVAAGWCVLSGSAAKACEVAHRSSYGSVMNSTLAAAMSQQATQPATAGQVAPMRGGDPSAQDLVGLWQIVYTSGGQVTDQAFEVWHSDGTEEILDITPPAEENACFGVWVETSHDTVKVKHPSWTFDANGNLTGTAILRETITLERGENKFTGTYVLDFYDTSGNQTMHFTGEVQGTRITVE